MRRVLYLAYHFPPVGGGGVQRNAKFVRYLPEFGYLPVVVTGPGRTSYRWAPEDDSLLREIPDDVEVVRLPGPEPDRSTGWRGRAERWLDRPGPWVAWWETNAVAAAVTRDVEVVYLSLVPYSCAESAITIARALRKPLVVDLQDPWALDEMWVYPTALHRRLDLRRMRRALVASEAVVMNTPQSARIVAQQFPELASKLVVSIPNGFDGADFERVPPTRDDDAFRIVHSGYLHTDLGTELRDRSRIRRLLGGTLHDVDVLPRSHVYLLEAVDRLRADRPDLGERIEVHLAGKLTEADLHHTRGRPYVRTPGYLSHDETLELVRTADLLFLPMHDLPRGGRISIVPGKTYEYLATGRPILAAVPPGDARDLLVQAGNASICGPTDVGAMALLIAEAIERSRRGVEPRRPDPSVLEHFERRELTRALAAVFASVLEPERTGTEMLVA